MGTQGHSQAAQLLHAQRRQLKFGEVVIKMLPSLSVVSGMQLPGGYAKNLKNLQKLDLQNENETSSSFT